MRKTRLAITIYLYVVKIGGIRRICFQKVA